MSARCLYRTPYRTSRHLIGHHRRLLDTSCLTESLKTINACSVTDGQAHYPNHARYSRLSSVPSPGTPRSVGLTQAPSVAELAGFDVVCRMAAWTQPADMAALWTHFGFFANFGVILLGFPTRQRVQGLGPFVGQHHLYKGLP